MRENIRVKIRIAIAGFIFALLALAMCMGMSGCDNEKDASEIGEGPFYTLEEAYEAGWLTCADLQDIADLHNNNKQYAEKLDEKIAELVKEDAAWELRYDEKNPIVEAKAEDFSILKYYGIYHKDCYVVMLDEPYFYFPAVDVDEWKEIAGVQFHITSFYEIKVWKNNQE